MSAGWLDGESKSHLRIVYNIQKLLFGLFYYKTTWNWTLEDGLEPLWLDSTQFAPQISNCIPNTFELYFLIKFNLQANTVS